MLNMAFLPKINCFLAQESHGFGGGPLPTYPFPSVLVDCPTQFICTWIFICVPWPGMGLSYREIIECQYIGLFCISKSISYRTSHIEYLDILNTSDFFVFFRQKFSENSENSPKILKTHEPKSSTTTTTTTPKIPKKSPKILKICWKFAENSLKRRSFLKPSYRIVSRKNPNIVSISYRVEKSLSLFIARNSNKCVEMKRRWEDVWYICVDKYIPINIKQSGEK